MGVKGGGLSGGTIMVVILDIIRIMKGNNFLYSKMCHFHRPIILEIMNLKFSLLFLISESLSMSLI